MKTGTLILIALGIWLLLWIIKKIGTYNRGQTRRSTTSTSPSRPTPPSRPSDQVYRPRTNGGRPKIVFNAPATPASASSNEALDGLHDAFTGAPLSPSLGLNQCTSCKVYYHAESLAVLREENNGHCVACGSHQIVPLTTSEARTSGGRDYSPDLVTLATFRSHFDRVITLEAKVVDVRVSRRGSDFAVMFENHSWVKGLKLVFFRGTVRKVGGPVFIDGLKGRVVRVRGLLVNHHRFGPEIIISERSMILEVR